MPTIEMITKEVAIKKVRGTLSEDMDVMLDNIIEKEYGWVIFPQRKEYIETRDAILIPRLKHTCLIA